MAKVRFEDIVKRGRRADVVIGIDPDVDKSGIAVLDTETRGLRIAALSFPLLIDSILAIQKDCTSKGKSLKVVVEAGWLNRTYWHLPTVVSKQKAAALGASVGRNQQVGHDIIELCKHHGMAVDEVKPLRKCWQGADRKITTAELEAVTRQKIGRCNQEGRDAALLAWVMGGFPK